ncbi:hypothetical protein [Paludibacterium sp. B53371]|uniref:hypothetical protein n=1 Tax=Paludibacterium sp. B53371 TaxID=2806263 RepID=UPI001C04A3E0|nr:hypothetical protein [Paludibacterium sp. B53371]
MQSSFATIRNAGRAMALLALVQCAPSWAGNVVETSATCQLSSMPSFSKSFNIPMASYYPSEVDLVFRYYQKWGNGSETGWESPARLPTVTVAGQTVQPVVLSLYGTKGWDHGNYYNFNHGAYQMGYDQFAQYYMVRLPAGYANTPVTIAGPYDQTASISLVMYAWSNDQQTEIYDKDLGGDCNPYLPGAASVFAYPEPTGNNTAQTAARTSAETPHQPEARPAVPVPAKSTRDDSDGFIPVYRPDQDTSSAGNFLDERAPDGCSSSYLIAYPNANPFTNTVNPNNQVMIMRMKVPTTFIDSDHPDTVFGNYQARYFSVGAHTNNPNPTLQYWTVNARMMNKYKDKDGYAYVFFAPDSTTQLLASYEHTDPSVPPVVTWGKYKGFLLGSPDYGIILRYKVSAANWQGNPVNATCYRWPWDQQPVNATQLGDYLPEIYGGTSADFDSGHLGAVSNNADWPTHS